MKEMAPKKDVDPATKRFRYLVGTLFLTLPVIGFGLLELAKTNPEAALSILLLAGVASWKMLSLRRG